MTSKFSVAAAIVVKSVVDVVVVFENLKLDEKVFNLVNNKNMFNAPLSRSREEDIEPYFADSACRAAIGAGAPSSAGGPNII